MVRTFLNTQLDWVFLNMFIVQELWVPLSRGPLGPLDSVETEDLRLNGVRSIVLALRYNRKLWMDDPRSAAYPLRFVLRQRETKGYAVW